MHAPADPQSTSVTAALLALLVLPVLLAGCADQQPAQTPAATECSLGPTVSAPPDLIDRLDLGETVAWAQVQANATSVNANGTALDTDLATVLAQVRGATEDQGWTTLTLDDEGFESELLARNGAGELLGVTLRQGTCPDQVLVLVSVTDYGALS